MEQFVAYVVTVICAVIASSGFWAWLQKRAEKKDVKTELLVGLAHDRIMALGLKYIKRGSISSDEYENLSHYLYEPYHKLGGNGSAERIIEEVNHLPIHEE